jgi:phosphatidylglycerophosphatase C
MNLALFDFDGTITTREMFADFMQFAVPPRRLAAGKIFFAPLVMGYKPGIVPANTIRASVVNFGFRGVPATTVRQAGLEFSNGILPGVIRPMALERIQWHKAQGDKVVVVSGALDVYLSHWCSQHQVNLICSELAVDDGVLTGRYNGKQCVGKEKPRRILEKYNLRDFPVLYAYGDTKEDLDMLRLADKRYFRWQEVT